MMRTFCEFLCPYADFGPAAVTRTFFSCWLTVTPRYFFFAETMTRTFFAFL